MATIHNVCTCVHATIHLKNPCDKCNYKAAQKHGLILHTKSEHEGGIFSILLANQTNIAHKYI